MYALAANECLACGEHATTRCSSGLKAGLDAWFCSPACQQLLWPAHRLFCGPGKANPFTWPPLSAEEREWCFSNLDVPAGGNAHPSLVGMTLRQYLRDRARTTLAKVPFVLQQFTHPQIPNDDETQYFSFCVRGFRHQHAGSLVPGSIGREGVAPVTLMTIACTMLEFPVTKTPWRTPLLHLATLFATIPDTHPNDNMLTLGVLRRMETYLRPLTEDGKPERELAVAACEKVRLVAQTSLANLAKAAVGVE